MGKKKKKHKQKNKNKYRVQHGPKHNPFYVSPYSKGPKVKRCDKVPDLAEELFGNIYYCIGADK